MIIDNSKVILFLSILLLGWKAEAQTRLIDESKVSDEGLFFDGEKGIDYQFGQRISPHGSCMDVVGDYIYLTWYQGGMDQRRMMLSRRKISGGSWKTIAFPDVHIGYRGDSTKGDSHNTIAVGISPIDHTVHLVYDMHAYSKKDFPTHYFNYKVSQKGGAIVPDEKWDIAIFSEKLHQLNEEENYERFTYPNLFRGPDGLLFLNWRVGGSGNGNHCLAYYDGEAWSRRVIFNEGNQGSPSDNYSIYGGFKFLSGQLQAGFSIRYSDYTTSDRYVYNTGLYYAYSKLVDGQLHWYSAKGEEIAMPLQNPNSIKIGEPLDLGLGKTISTSPSWTVTDSKAAHFINRVDDTYVHYYKAANGQDFEHEIIDFDGGSLFSFGEQVINLGLEEGRPVIRSTPAGSNDWKEEYHYQGDKKFKFGTAVRKDDQLFYYLMEDQSGDAQPLYVLIFKIEE